MKIRAQLQVSHIDIASNQLFLRLRMDRYRGKHKLPFDTLSSTEGRHEVFRWFHLVGSYRLVRGDRSEHLVLVTPI